MRTTSYVESREMKITEADTSVEHGLIPYRHLREFFENVQVQRAIEKANALRAIAEEEAKEANGVEK